MKAEIAQAGTHAAADAKVAIASVPTLARSGARLARFQPDEFPIVVVDEAHHAVAPSYRRIFDHFGLFDPNVSRYLVGFTATPRRGDKQGLGEVFEEVCYARGLREMIADHYLCPITGCRVDTDFRSAPVWGELSRDQRRSTLAAFSAGEIDVVTICNVLT